MACALTSLFSPRSGSSQYLSQRSAQAIDVELMSPTGGGFTFDQLVELGKRPDLRTTLCFSRSPTTLSHAISSLSPAGFSVAQAITKEFHRDEYPRVVVFSGPGNNGLDGESTAPQV
jgi:NAD(P)H-hydrate epimerase